MNIFNGVIVPMISPVLEDNSIDVQSVAKIVDLISKHGCAPFVIGTTGEAASLSASQKSELVSATVKAANGNVPVFAGISGTSLTEAIEQARQYKDQGADIFVTTLPYYYPISETEMLRFFESLADGIEAPLVLYNMPAMVGKSIPLDIADQLSQHPWIIGMKDSERNIERIESSIEMWKDRVDFGFYQGWAAQSAHALKLGANGIVPSTANFAPEPYQKLFEASKMGNFEEAQNWQTLTDDLSLVYQKDRALNQSLPALKAIMNELGLCQKHMIPPMYNIVQDEEMKVLTDLRKIVNKYNLELSRV